ncbi:MAG: site-2 protease family protein [Candidatus Bathyarchaeia archaeon]
MSEPYPNPPHQPFPAYDELQSLVESEFNVLDFYIELGVPTFVIAPGPTKEPFKSLATKLKDLGYLPFLRRDGERLLIRVSSKPTSGPGRPWLNVVLFLATVASVLASGYMIVYNSSLNPVLQKVYSYHNQEFNVLTQALFLAVSVLSTLGLHELGHLLLHRVRGVGATLPYFIPLPLIHPLGTLGAVILQKEPPTNRDELFDLGFSGPLVGFLTTLIVTIISLRFFTFLVPTDMLVMWAQQHPGSVSAIEYPPLLFQILSPIINPSQGGYTTVLTPVAVMTLWIMVLNFLNLMPVWQFDGGWVSLSIFGPKRQRTVSYISAGVMFLLGQPYWVMAMLALFGMWSIGTGVGPLDAVSPVSTSRKASSLVLLLIIILCVKYFPYF